MTLEAEDADLRGPAVSAAVPGYTGTGFADFRHDTGDWIEWTFDVAEAGSYALAFRYANGGAAQRELDFDVDGRRVINSMFFNPTGHWAAWDARSEVVTLATGRHTVRLTAVTTSGPNLDSLTVRPAATPA